MDHVIGIFFNVLMLGLIIHWILGFIKSSPYSQIEKARSFLNNIFNPFLDLIKNKINPIVKMQDGNAIDFSPLILLIIIAITRKFIYFIF